MTKYRAVFERMEVKYRVSEKQYKLLMPALEEWVQPDEYPESEICNIYYDSPENEMILRSIQKPKYKEKLRLRSYGVPSEGSMVFAELKKKYAGIVYKRRTAMPYQAAVHFLEEQEEADRICVFPDCENAQILKELRYVRDFYRARPALFIAYHRTSFAGKTDPKLRITFDNRIRFRKENLSLSAGDDGTYLDMQGDSLMEVKAGGALPLPLVRIFGKLNIYPASFSKYGEIFKLYGGNHVYKCI